MTDGGLHLVVAINPTASFGHGQDIGPRVVDRLRDAGHIVRQLTEPTMDILRVKAARAIHEDGADALIVVGGDGMVSFGTNLVARTDTPLGIIPSGTGNDFARGLGIPIGDTEAAIDLLLDALTRPARVIDAGRIRHSPETGGATRTLWFAGILSAGFDALVNERANKMRRPRGKSRYTVALIRELVSLHPIEYTLDVDGVITGEKAMLLAVANNVSIGGGMMITPDAKLDDGKLDLFLVKPLSRFRFARLFPKVFKGTHTGLDIVRIERVSSVRIDAPRVIAYADGERVGPLPVHVDIVPGALRILGPAIPR